MTGLRAMPCPGRGIRTGEPARVALAGVESFPGTGLAA